MLVAKQVEPGPEALVGMTRDPDFGPVLVVGRGGSAVEQLDSVLATVAPLGLDDDRDGVVARTLVAVSELSLAHPGIESVDVNPLVLTPDGTVAVDALIVVAEPEWRLTPDAGSGSLARE